MASFSFALHNPKSERKTRIRLQIRYGSKHGGYKAVNISSRESVLPTHWDGEKQKVIKVIDRVDINNQLEQVRETAKAVYRRYINDHDNPEPSPQTLKELIEIKMKWRFREEKLDFFGHFDKFTEIQTIKCLNQGKDPKKTIIKDYVRSCELLADFSKRYRKLEFSNIDDEFYGRYVKYLRETVGFKNNTVGKHIKCLKAFLNWATNKGINKNLEFRAKDFKVLTEESGHFFLTEQELHIMKDLELRPALAKYRDSFLIACWTGLRHSDFSRLSSDNIDYEEELIRVKTLKTKHPLVIPFLPELKEIIQKYEGQVLPAYANQPMNRYLKEIGEIMANKVKELDINGDIREKDYSKLTTHTGRRSFCSNMYYRGIDIEMIMAISGHKTEAQFRKYIKVENEDKAARFLRQAQERRPTVTMKIAT